MSTKIIKLNHNTKLKRFAKELSEHTGSKYEYKLKNIGAYFELTNPNEPVIAIAYGSYALLNNDATFDIISEDTYRKGRNYPDITKPGAKTTYKKYIANITQLIYQEIHGTSYTGQTYTKHQHIDNINNYNKVIQTLNNDPKNDYSESISTLSDLVLFHQRVLHEIENA